MTIRSLLTEDIQCIVLGTRLIHETLTFTNIDPDTLDTSTRIREDRHEDGRVQGTGESGTINRHAPLPLPTILVSSVVCCGRVPFARCLSPTTRK